MLWKLFFSKVNGTSSSEKLDNLIFMYQKTSNSVLTHFAMGNLFWVRIRSSIN